MCGIGERTPMHISIEESIAKCQKHISKYYIDGQVQFDQIEDPEEREKIDLLSDYMWLLQSLHEQAHHNCSFSMTVEE